MKLRASLLAALASVAFAGAAPAQTIVVGGTAADNLKAALTTLGYTYSDQTPTMTPDPSGLGAGDYIFIGNDGGTDSLLDYTSFLNAGGHVVVAGGSNYQPYRDWVATYFTTTDTGSGWHTDGAWHKTSASSVNAFLPQDYTFNETNMTYHMLGFLAAADVTLLGVNDEPVAIAAIKTYANGGTFHYMALDIGGAYTDAGDQANFVVPFVQGAFNLSAVPEPTTLALCGLGLCGAAIGGWKRRKRQQGAAKAGRLFARNG